MSQVLILLRKSLLVFSRSRAAVSITFLVPIAIIYIFGHVFGLYKKTDTGPTGIPLAVVNASTNPAATKLVDALKEEKTFRVIDSVRNRDGTTRPLTEADARRGMNDDDYRFALILPPDLLPEGSFGIRLRFLTNPRNEIESQTVNGMVQKTIFSHVPELLGESMRDAVRRHIGAPALEGFNGELANAYAKYFNIDREKILKRLDSADYGLGVLSAPGGKAGEDREPEKAKKGPGATDVFSRIVKIDTEQVAGRELSNPMAARTVGGYAVMFLLFAVSNSAATLFEEKNTGIFVRLLSAPVRPAHIIWARFLFGMILGIVQIIALFLAGHFLFHLDIFSHAAALLAVGVAAAAACSAFGLLIASVSPNSAAASGIATFVVITMSAVGGAWFPVSLMPDYIQRISKLTIVYWSVEGFSDVLWAGHTLVQVLPKIGILVAITAAVMAVSVACFRRGKLFD
jgi:ABC-2 type transport system permease protein